MPRRSTRSFIHHFSLHSFILLLLVVKATASPKNAFSNLLKQQVGQTQFLNLCVLLTDQVHQTSQSKALDHRSRPLDGSVMGEIPITRRSPTVSGNGSIIVPNCRGDSCELLRSTAPVAPTLNKRVAPELLSALASFMYQNERDLTQRYMSNGPNTWWLRVLVWRVVRGVFTQVVEVLEFRSPPQEVPQNHTIIVGREPENFKLCFLLPPFLITAFIQYILITSNRALGGDAEVDLAVLLGDMEHPIPVGDQRSIVAVGIG